MTLGPAQINQEMTRKCIYIIWNIWKERCRRVFDNRALNEDQLTSMIKHDDIHLWIEAHRPNNEPVAPD
jgi:hypothetical protein